MERLDQRESSHRLAYRWGRVAIHATLTVAIGLGALFTVATAPLPVAQAATCNAVAQPLPFEIDFSSQVGCVAEKDGELTGFNGVQVNKSDTEYDANLIDLDTTAGTLTLTSTATVSTSGTISGTSFNFDNSQVNALETTFDASAPGITFTKVFTVSARILGPLNTIDNKWEQGAIYLGPNQDNYVKLAVIGGKRGKNTTSIEFVDEQLNGGFFARSLNDRTSVVNITTQATTTTSLDLALVADQEAGKINAYYSINDGPLQQIPIDITLLNNKKNLFFNATTKAGILVAHKNADAPIALTFDRFAIRDAQRPGANAGPDLSAPSSMPVQLNGSLSAAPLGRTLAAYGWTLNGAQPASFGSGVTLNDSSAISPTFTAPAGSGVLTFTLVVTDSAGVASTPDSMRVVVGEKLITSLDVTASSPVLLGEPIAFTATVNADATNVVYAWDFGDNQENPNDNNRPNLSYTYEAPGVYTVTVVALNTGSTLTDTIVVQVNNTRPTADAGLDQVVALGSQVSLAGSGSDPDPGQKLTFQWQQIGGLPVTLSNSTTLTPAFTAPLSSTILTFRLSVTDVGGAIATDTVQVRVGENVQNGIDVQSSSPTVLGRTTFFTATTTGLNLTYSWNFGDGSAAATGATASHVYTAEGTYVATVTVTDGGTTRIATNQVVVTNAAPTANAGSNRTVRNGVLVGLSGSGTDPDGHTPLTYQWRQVGGKAVTLLPNTDPAKTSFVATASTQPLVFELTVTDARGKATTATVQITVEGQISFLSIIVR